MSGHAVRLPLVAELLKRTFAVDVLDCPRCPGQARMRLIAMLTSSGALPTSRRSAIVGVDAGAGA